LKSGLTDCGFTDQCHFLLSLGLNDYLQKTFAEEPDMILAAKKASFISHTLLFDMGPKFKVLIQSKGVPQAELTGLKYMPGTALV
jgi:SAM-dependent MidA family methyltransferase